MVVPMDLPDRVGGRPVLDFLNTVDPRHAADRREYLPDYAALLAFLGTLDVVLPAGVQELTRVAEADPAQAEAVHRQALALREALYPVFSAALTKQRIQESDLELVNTELCRATDHHVLRPDPAGGLCDGWTQAQSLDSPLWPISIDAWDLLTTDVLARVRECPGEGTCGWLFLDTSRSGTRRWCDMRTCGNRAKVRTHYIRRQDSGPTGLVG
jgi:predicted RNA-binding Zn ribbon-like protein